MNTVADAIGLTVQQPLRLHFPLPDLPGQPARPVPTLAASAAAPIHDTLGWDTVFAVPVSEVNKHFAQPGLYPLDFAGTLQGQLFKVEVGGKFKPWSIGLGGSGAIVFLAIEIESGTLTGGQAGPVDLARGQLQVAVKMHYLPQPKAGDVTGEGGTANQLRISSAPMSGSGHAAQVMAVTIPGRTDPTLLSAISGAFQDFFDKHLERITYVFNTVNLGAVADEEAFQWLQPTTTSYAYYDAATLDKAVFGVLCMVKGNSPAQNASEIGPGSIPAKAQSCLSISRQAFVREMALPVMANAFNANTDHPVDASYFEPTNADTVIVNTRTVPLPTVMHAGLHYYPEMTDFSMTLQATELVVYNKIHVNISPGIEAYVESTHYYRMKLVEGAAGKQMLAYETARPTVTNHWIDVSTGIIVTEIIIGIVGAVAAGVAAWAMKGGTAIAVAIVIGVVAGVVAAIPQMISKVAGEGTLDDLPSIDGMVTAATNNVTWKGGHDFRIALAQLNGSLQLGGAAFPA